MESSSVVSKMRYLRVVVAKIVCCLVMCFSSIVCCSIALT